MVVRVPLAYGCAMRTDAAILAVLALVSCNSDAGNDEQSGVPSGASEPAQVSVSSSEPVIRIYEHDANVIIGLEAEDTPVTRQGEVRPHSIVVWADGRIVWRINETSFEGKFHPAKLEELMRRLQHEGAFDKERRSLSSFGPDSAYEVIEVTSEGRSIHFESWHDLYEQSPQVVATDHGLSSLGGRDKRAVLAATAPEYQQFRRTWSDIRSTVESWIPPDGKPITR